MIRNKTTKDYEQQSELCINDCIDLEDYLNKIEPKIRQKLNHYAIDCPCTR
jgi:RNA polymerase sporulation-specific sigma factor